MQEHLKCIGLASPKHDDLVKVSGRLNYAEDFSMPGMLHAKVLRSKYPAAKILSIDTARAEALPGVKAVLTAKDVPHNNTITKFGQSKDVGGGFEALYRVLAEDKVRFTGEAVALVAAETVTQAEEAVKLIDVQYEPLPGVYDVEEAVKPDSYKVGEDDTNIIAHFKSHKGDVVQGFAEADAIVENTYRVPFVDHTYLEPESGVAWIDEQGVLTIRVSTQVIEHFRGIAKVLGWPENKVRVIGTMLGGGFGGKEDITVESFIALLTVKTGRPVKLTYTREESFIAHSKRHRYVMRYKIGAKNDGKITAIQAEVLSDSGAYPYLSPWVLMYSTVCAAGPYVIDHVAVDCKSALTNNPFGSANRGFGSPQVNFAYESIISELAEKLGISPLEIREKNCIRQGNVLAGGMKMDRYVALPDVGVKAWEAIDAKAKPVPADESKKVGRGMAIGMMTYGRMTFLHDTSRSYIRVELDGSLTIRCGVPDLGGGQAASLCQIAAEELGVPLTKVKIYISDTALTPLAGTTTATRQLYMSGNATLKAAKVLRQRLLERASAELNVPADQLDLADEKVVVTAAPEKSLPLKQVILMCSGEGIELFHEAQFNAPFTDVPDLSNVQGQVHPDFTFGAHSAEVSVDTETGEVEVLNIVSCFDVGRVLNPLRCEGQMEGGSIYCMGYALTEEILLNDGITLNPSFTDYAIPTALDAPNVESITVESGAGLGPYGAKGIGEPSCNSIAPAIIQAIYDAVGIRVRDLPATPEKILALLKEKGRDQ